MTRGSRFKQVWGAITAHATRGVPVSLHVLCETAIARLPGTNFLSFICRVRPCSPVPLVLAAALVVVTGARVAPLAPSHRDADRRSCGRHHDVDTGRPRERGCGPFDLWSAGYSVASALGDMTI